MFSFPHILYDWMCKNSLIGVIRVNRSVVETISDPYFCLFCNNIHCYLTGEGGGCSLELCLLQVIRDVCLFRGACLFHSHI